MFRDIQIDLIILKTDDKQFTLAAEKKSLRITFKFQQLVSWSFMSLFSTNMAVSETINSNK